MANNNHDINTKQSSTSQYIGIAIFLMSVSVLVQSQPFEYKNDGDDVWVLPSERSSFSSIWMNSIF